MKRLYYIYDQNGMSNRLFPFAHLIAFGLEHGIEITNPVFDRYAEYFVGTNPRTRRSFWEKEKEREPAIRPPRFQARSWRMKASWVRRFARSAWVAMEASESLALPNLLQKNMREVWVSGLYAIDNHSFTKHSALIRRCFSPVDDVKRRAEASLTKARKLGDLIIGVHIRQGDYRTFADGMMFFETSEYAELMESAERLWMDRQVAFVVCSDVQQSQDAFGRCRWTAGPGDEAGDLIALSQCDYLIAPQSTYSQWASWYGKTPRYLHNRKYEAAYGIKPKKLTQQAFIIHELGFGRYQNPR